jgi:hypothetical protein
MQISASERALKRRITPQRNLVLTRHDLHKNDGNHWRSLKEATINSVVHHKVMQWCAHILLLDTTDFSVRFLKNRTNTDLVTLRMNDQELHTTLLKMGVEAGEQAVTEPVSVWTAKKRQVKRPPLRRPPLWDLGD